MQCIVSPACIVQSALYNIMHHREPSFVINFGHDVAVRFCTRQDNFHRFKKCGLNLPLVCVQVVITFEHCLCGLYSLYEDVPASLLTSSLPVVGPRGPGFRSRGLHPINPTEKKTRLDYNDVIMSTMASQITRVTIVYSTVYPGVDQRKHQSSALLAFVRGIYRSPVNSSHKGPVTRKMFPFDDVIIISQVAWYGHGFIRHIQPRNSKIQWNNIKPRWFEVLTHRFDQCRHRIHFIQILITHVM